MKLCVMVQLCALLTLTQEAPGREKCACELSSREKLFPHEKLRIVKANASDCNSNITPQKTVELESLLLGLERRLAQLHKDVQVLEKEDDGELYGVLSLYVIENEMTEKLLKCNKDLNTTVAPTEPPQGTCPRSRLLNVTGPRVYTAGEYPGSYSYGAWGRDPRPEQGKESWYWLVMMTSNNRYAHYVRLYSSLSALIIGVSVPGNIQIHSSNPATNTIQGPNNVLYGGALYYNCYNQDAVCRFNLTTKAVTTLQLPKGTRYNSKGNFCHLEECYPYTDLDLATDDSGVWVIYTTNQDYGNLVLSKVEEGEPPKLGQTWRTSVYKQAVTNTFMACGVLYATRYINRGMEEIFYSFNTVTGTERFNIGIFINKMSPNIQALNYSPVDQMLHAYCDSNMVSYKMLFG
ncbi:olfactomedin-4-like isoform X2 [Archocentrus centrarchus]|uniref:olfactomedin-4-like isoform X2 n=1 Tax=Archocentrus centrarchus TaxID=63155 RepID=UPI0011EA3529|nr:olfactomedin-4-like isoform X2 [Archocentrus centrarchus]